MKKSNKIKPDYSKEHKLYLRKQRTSTFLVIFTQIGILVAFLALWEILTRAEIVDAFFVSSPTRVIKTIKELYVQGELFLHMGVTLAETVIAFAIATTVGFVLAFLLWLSNFSRRVFEPYLVVLNSLPKVALGPLVIVWFGIGYKAIIIMAILIVVIVTTISVLNAFLSCDQNLISLCKSMGANRMQIFFKVVLPNAIPDIVTILKINVGLSWVGTIMGEYLASRAGLGYLLINAGTVVDLDVIITSIILLSILAVGMYLVVALFEHWVKK